LSVSLCVFRAPLGIVRVLFVWHSFQHKISGSPFAIRHITALTHPQLVKETYPKHTPQPTATDVAVAAAFPCARGLYEAFCQAGDHLTASVWTCGLGFMGRSFNPESVNRQKCVHHAISQCANQPVHCAADDLVINICDVVNISQLHCPDTRNHRCTITPPWRESMAPAGGTGHRPSCRTHTISYRTEIKGEKFSTARTAVK
jgi:hypothetical protein